MCIRDRDVYLAAQYQRLRARRGHKKALGAVKHSILVACWHMLLAMSRFIVLARPRPGDGWTVFGAEAIERVAEEWMAQLVDGYGRAIAAVAALVCADPLDASEGVAS